jgi:RNA polymerase sigma factor (sigma-70 family)
VARRDDASRVTSGGATATSQVVSLPDTTLVEEALHGDERAFAALVERHRGRTLRSTRVLLGDVEEAQDVVQDALLVAHSDLGRLREPERFGAWLGAIATNLARMRLRARRAGWTTIDELRGGVLATDPEEHLEALELALLVRSELDALPPGQREVARLYYLGGLSAPEIAELRGETPGAVRVRLHRARNRLRDRLADPTTEEEPMIEVELQDVLVRVVAEDADADVPRLANRDLRIVLLAESGGDRVLPIWIGAFEGDALALRHGGAEMPRPMTPDLMARLVEATGSTVDRVAITRLEAKTFYATVTLALKGRREDLDARPSDALNLALRVGAPIVVAEEVMAEAGQVIERLEDLDREYESGYCESGPGAWRSLSAELVKALWPKPPEPTK